jgi:hypothetical protein
MKIEELYSIVPSQELHMIKQSCELRAVFSDFAKRIGRIPALLETDDDNNAKAVLHYFNIFGSGDWYVFEANLETGEGFGFVTLSGGIADSNAEFGYINLFELAKSASINLDLHYYDGITKNQIWLQKYGQTLDETSEEMESEKETVA